MTTQNKLEDYLGDGVYASWDGHHIILDLRGQDDYTLIALDDQTLEALDRYRTRLKSHLEHSARPSEMDALTPVKTELEQKQDSAIEGFPEKF